MTPTHTSEADPTPPFEAAVETFLAGSGARMAALLDRSGGVLAQSGFAEVGHTADVAALVSGLYASGRRIGELTGSDAPNGTITLGAGRLEVREIVGPHKTLLLFSVFDRPASAVALAGATQDLRRTLDRPGRPPVHGGLENSLLDRLDEAFPKS